MATTKYWKVWLTPNLLTKDIDNDYIAEVSTSKQTLRNEDIAQRIVEQHGGQISVESQNGKNVFSFTVPRVPKELPPPAPPIQG